MVDFFDDTFGEFAVFDDVNGKFDLIDCFFDLFDDAVGKFDLIDDVYEDSKEDRVRCMNFH